MDLVWKTILRKLFISCVPKNGLRYLSEKNIEGKYNKFNEKNIAYESEYYYRQDKELLKLLKQKTEEEVKMMQNKVRTMEHKIKEYNRDISETLRFLEGLDKKPVKEEK